MTPVLETVFYYLLTAFLVLLVIWPIGQLCAVRLIKGSDALKLAASLCFGVLVVSLLTTILYFSGLSNHYIQLFFSLLIALTLAATISEREKWPKLDYKHLLGAALALCLGLFCTLILCFPTGSLEEALVDTSMYFTNLPVDLLIPYNFARMLIERIDPNSVEIVPGWGAADRGPVSGLFVAGIFYTLGLKENAHWLGTSQGLFFIYQSLIIFLNSLALFIVWLVCLEWFNLRVAALASLSLLTCYFFLLNTMFAWPKFFMAAILLLSLWLWLEKKQWLSAGIFAGLAMLVHDSAVFTIAAFLLFAFISECREFFSGRQRRIIVSIKGLASYLAGFALIISPWLLAKATLLKTSPRLLYMHLFCFTGESLEGVSFSSLLSQYLITNSLFDILKVRLLNILYPFNPSTLWQVYKESSSFYEFLHGMSPQQFFQISVSAGLPLCIIFILALSSSKKFDNWEKVVSCNIVCFSSIIFVSAISGCLNNTVSHIWAYPAFLSGAIAIAGFVSNAKGLYLLLFAIGVAFNSVLSFLYLWYRPVLKPFLHASPQYTYALLCLIGLMGLIVAASGFFFQKEQA